SGGRSIIFAKSVSTYGGRRGAILASREFELPLNDRGLGMVAAIGDNAGLLASAGICRFADRGARHYGFRFASSANLAVICFPYYNPGSGERVTARLRRDNPEVDIDGKPQNKYILAYGDTRHLYFPPDARSLLTDVSVTVALVEAEKSALA